MNWSKFASLKGELEAEGLPQTVIAAESLYAARRGLDYLVKIGGCEAKSDMRFLMAIGVTSIVAPMIESAFAMRKYQDMLPEGAFEHVGVTIETIDAVRRVDAILDAGVKLTEVTIGRHDLTDSFGGTGVDSPETLGHVKTVARAARSRGLNVTMGGSVNKKTREILRSDPELRELIGAVETRKVVMTVPHFLEDGVLESAIDVELELLDRLVREPRKTVTNADARAKQIRERL